MRSRIHGARVGPVPAVAETLQTDGVRRRAPNGAPPDIKTKGFHSEGSSTGASAGSSAGASTGASGLADSQTSTNSILSSPKTAL